MTRPRPRHLAVVSDLIETPPDVYDALVERTEHQLAVAYAYAAQMADARLLALTGRARPLPHRRPVMPVDSISIELDHDEQELILDMLVDRAEREAGYAHIALPGQRTDALVEVTRCRRLAERLDAARSRTNQTESVMPEKIPNRDRWRHLRDVDHATDPRVYAAALKAEWSIGLDLDGLAQWFSAAQDAAVAEALVAARRLPNRYEPKQLGFTLPGDCLSLTIWDVKRESPDVLLVRIESDRDYAPPEIRYEDESYEIDRDVSPDEALHEPGHVYRYVRHGKPGTPTPAAFVPIQPTVDEAREAVVRQQIAEVGANAALDALQAHDAGPDTQAWGMADITSTEGAASYLDQVARHLTEMQARQIERACADLLRQGHEPVIVKDRDGQVTVMARCDYRAKYGDS